MKFVKSALKSILLLFVKIMFICPNAEFLRGHCISLANNKIISQNSWAPQYFLGMVHFIFVHNPLFNYKMQFYWKKNVCFDFRCNWRTSKSWWRHIDKCIAIRYLLITCRDGFTERKQLHLIVCTYHFVFSWTPLSSWDDWFFHFLNPAVVSLLSLCDITVNTFWSD